ncbi:MAG TPA: FAD-binding protein [Dongiaceae bacterium]|nr:FAD-binding protein [Dongiaceae bacterium]
MNSPEIGFDKRNLREKSAAEQFLARHQQWVIGLVVMPVSYFNHLYQRASHFLAKRRATQSASDVQVLHREKVHRVMADVQRWAALPAERRPPIRTDRSGAASHSVRSSDKSGSHQVRMHDFNRILGIDLAKGTVTIEPFVTVGELTTWLLQHDRMLEATLEMEDATLGGLALSQGMTTHSHRCGLVHDTVMRYEFVTGRGDCIEATATGNADVFRAAGFSHGTLGFLTALELKIVPASRELLVSYQRCDSIDELYRQYRHAIEHTDAFFLEAIIYSPRHAVLIRGDLLTPATQQEARSRGVRTNHQGRWHKPWFFVHAEKVPNGHQEFMPMRDYLMRHDRSLCMTMLYVFPAGNHPLMRWLLGWMLPPKVTFLKALRPPEAREDAAREQVYQDLAFPIEHLADMVDYVDARLGIYPLLLYPCKVHDHGGFIRHPGERGASDDATRTRYYLNLGIYGVPNAVRIGDPHFNVISEVRGLLEKLRGLGGFQHSYCDVFQTREEFYRMFDVTLSNAVRKRLGSEQLVTVYDKVKPEIPWEDWSSPA